MSSIDGGIHPDKRQCLIVAATVPARMAMSATLKTAGQGYSAMKSLTCPRRTRS